MVRRARRTGSRDDGEGRRRGIGRYLLYVMGPPDLGDPDEAPPAPSRMQMDCGSCGRPMSEHTIDRRHGKSLTFCPPVQPTAPGEA